MESWVGLGTSMVSKQSAQNRYVTAITAISCLDRQASPGQLQRMGLAGLQAATLTTESPGSKNKTSCKVGFCVLCLKHVVKIVRSGEVTLLSSENKTSMNDFWRHVKFG